MAGEPAQLRFAVLHHTGVSRPHYDLLIEAKPGALLLTLRCERWPLRDGDVVTRQPDHRRIYLDYEGPVSGNRGEVKRIASGSCHLRHQTRDRITVQLADDTVELVAAEGERWRVTFL